MVQLMQTSANSSKMFQAELQGVGLLSSIFAANDSGMHTPDDPWPKSRKNLFSNCIRLHSFHFCFSRMSYTWGVLGHDSHDYDMMGPMAAPRHIHNSHDHGIMRIHDIS